MAWDSEWWLVLVGEGDEPEVFIFEDDARTWARQLDAENPDGAPHVVVRVVRPLATPTPPVAAPPSEESAVIRRLNDEIASLTAQVAQLSQGVTTSLSASGTPPSAAVSKEDIAWLQRMRDAVLDGNAVYAALPFSKTKHLTPNDVSDVLDAVAKVARAAITVRADGKAT